MNVALMVLASIGRGLLSFFTLFRNQTWTGASQREIIPVGVPVCFCDEYPSSTDTPVLPLEVRL